MTEETNFLLFPSCFGSGTGHLFTSFRCHRFQSTLAANFAPFTSHFTHDLLNKRWCNLIDTSTLWHDEGIVT